MTPDELRAFIEDELGISQVQTAWLLGVHPRSVRHWIMGDRPFPETARRLLLAMTHFDDMREWLRSLGAKDVAAKLFPEKPEDGA